MSDDHSHHHGHSHEGHSHHAHSHGHHHSFDLSADGGRLSKVFYWAIGLNLAYVALEAFFGFMTDSMGLLSDAGHNLSDVASLFIALIAFKASQKPPTPGYSYGYGRATVEASLANAVILYIAVFFIAFESVNRLFHPTHVDGIDIAWVAAAGVAVNGITAWLLMRSAHSDLNVKGAFMHMLADTLVSVGVVASGVVIHFTGWEWVDPIVGIGIAVIIAVSSWSMLRESLCLALDGVPKNVNLKEVKETIANVKDVRSFHHLHVWAMSTTENALTVHVLVDRPDQIDSVIENVRKALAEIGIGHSTIEAETSKHDCGYSGIDQE